jgi:hypothetical protein
LKIYKKANKLRVWLDDERDPQNPFWYDEFPELKEGGWTWLKTVEECQELISRNMIGFISFDNDLGYEQEGRHLASWVEEKAFNKEIEPFGWDVHSKNSIAGPKIEIAMRNADRFWGK